MLHVRTIRLYVSVLGKGHSLTIVLKPFKSTQHVHSTGNGIPFDSVSELILKNIL